ncbi:MAG: cation transporter, partial [Fretibacterium sp.]|nr:cation transporter [Fretibacterium sp.]
MQERTLSENAKWVQAVLWIVLVCNLLVSAIKIAVGLATGMPSVTADGYHSVTDGFSNIVGLIGIH